MSERMLITGANGQLGRALQEQYPEAHAVDRDELDISNYDTLRAYDWENVSTIINAAAYTKVDEAETPEGLVTAWQANATGVANLATVAREHDLTLIHFSTDYVFDGQKENPYTEEDTINPQNVYGASKAAGELAATLSPKTYIVRTSWVIGDGGNFVKTMLKLGADKENLTIVNDQIGRPTFTTELVRATDHLLHNDIEAGTYHVSNSGEATSWADLARKVFEVSGLACEVTNTTTKEYFANKEVYANRPLNSVFNLEKIQSTGFESEDWQTALKTYLEEIT